jgi:predicted RNA-binding protein with PIN domain
MSRGGALHLLVDGHNVIHQDAALRKLAGEIEDAHAELELLLAERSRIIIFYDGGPGGQTHTLRRSGLTIDYSGASEADDRIVRWLLFNPNLRAMVVSDDRALIGRVRTLGAKVMPARGFLESFRKRTTAATPDRAPLTSAEVDEWMRIFGIDDGGT